MDDIGVPLCNCAAHFARQGDGAAQPTIVCRKGSDRNSWIDWQVGNAIGGYQYSHILRAQYLRLQRQYFFEVRRDPANNSFGHVQHFNRFL